MQKVITINLNGNAYQLDESGYDALRAYLNHADAQLGGNPDKAEIIRDLEQSIAEKCMRFLGPGKSVVSAPKWSRSFAISAPSMAEPLHLSGRGSAVTACGQRRRLLRHIQDGSIRFERARC